MISIQHTLNFFVLKYYRWIRIITKQEEKILLFPILMYMCIYLGIFRINPIVNLLPRISLPNFYILMDLLQPVSIVPTFYYLLKNSTYCFQKRL